MKIHESAAFWEGGADAWWQGLRDAVRSAEKRLKTATSDEARQSAQAELEDLQRQQRDASQNGHRWLF